MVYWETAHTLRDQPRFVLDFARQWQTAEKIVYSRTLAEPRSVRTKIEPEFHPDAEHDITVDGSELAAQAIRPGLVDEFQNDCLPRGRRQRKTVLPGWCAAGPRADRGAPLP